MHTALQLLNVLLPLGYLLAALAYLVVFLESPEWAKTWATRLTASVVGAHVAYLLLATLTYQHVPVANAWEGFTFIAFAMAVVYLALEWRWKDKATGVFLMVPVLFFQVLSSAFVTHTREVDEILRSPLFAVHVTAALLGYVALSVAAVYGAMYTLLYRELKKHRVGLIFRRLPNLETLSRLNIGAVFFGWIGSDPCHPSGKPLGGRTDVEGVAGGELLHRSEVPSDRGPLGAVRPDPWRAIPVPVAQSAAGLSFHCGVSPPVELVPGGKPVPFLLPPVLLISWISSSWV